MSILSVNTDFLNSFGLKNTFNDFFKFGSFIILFHIIASLVYNGPPTFGLTGRIFNTHFLEFIVIIFYTILAYNLVLSEIIQVN